MKNTCWPSRISLKRLSLKRLSLRRFMPCFEHAKPTAPATERKRPNPHIPTYAAASFLKTTTPSTTLQTDLVDLPSAIRYCPPQFSIPPSAMSEGEDPFLDPTTVPIKVLHHTFKRLPTSTMPRDQARALRAALPDPDTFHTRFPAQTEFMGIPGSTIGWPGCHDSIDLHRLRLGNQSTVWSEA